MKPESLPSRLALVVANPEHLQHGSTPRHGFDAAGGTIGGEGADWALTDQAGRIERIHCEIRYEDAAFCIVDRSGKTRVNDANEPLGALVMAKLRDGDVLHIGPYRVAVHLHDPHQELLEPGRHLAQYGVGELLSNAADGHDGLPTGAYVFETEHVSAPLDATYQALSAPHDARADTDPLRALDAAERTSELPPVVMDPWDVRRGGALAPTQADLASTRFEAVTGTPLPFPGDSRMPKSHDRPDVHSGTHSGTRTGSPYRLRNRQAMAGDPTDAVDALMQGLDVPLGPLDPQAGQALLLEAGQALNAAIKGIAGLYADQAGSAAPRKLLGRSLQPIEDNPLRLGQSYADTVRAMFAANRSVVHLSPKDAVDESLAQLRTHHDAVTQAIEAGLQALLRAFAPSVLMQRFRRYRPDQDAPAADDWAWGMYTHYYDELASARQRGFEKLFWEVFEQAYDRALRVEAE